MISWLGYCRTLILSLQPFCCRFDGMLGIIVATKQAPNHQPSTSMCDFCYEVYVLICLLYFHQTYQIMSKYLHFGLICSQVIVLEVLWFVQMQLCKPKPCCHAFLDGRSFLLASLPNRSCLSHILLTVLSWFWSFYILTEACGAYGEVLGRFLWALHGLILGWICWDVHSWEDWWQSWMSSTCE